jgi:hypothetical protein
MKLDGLCTPLAHDALHPPILATPDTDRVDNNPAIPNADWVDNHLPSPPGNVSALLTQRWTGVDPSLFSLKRTAPQLGVNASGPPQCSAPQISVDASSPKPQLMTERRFEPDHPSPVQVYDDGHASNDESVGGPVCSPRMVDHDRLACKRKSSHLDVLKLASNLYHLGYDGIRQLTEKIIFNCGLTKATGHVDDANFCFQDVFHVHKKVYNGWYDPRCNMSGPNVKYTVKKHWHSFPDSIPSQWRQLSNSMTTTNPLGIITSYL